MVARPMSKHGDSSTVVIGSSRAPRGSLLSRNLDIVAPSVVLAMIVFACFVWPVLYEVPAPVGGSVIDANLPLFSPRHPLGTDLTGNDVLSRLLHGGRTSLTIAVVVNALGLLAGGALGSLSGYLGGVADAFAMRVIDVLIAFPSLVLLIGIAQGVGPSQTTTIFALALVSVPAFARVARAGALQVCARTFVTAAQLSGTTRMRVLLRHIAPNILPRLLAFAALGMGIVITLEGGLSFIGLGVPQPHPSLGNMIFHGQQGLLIRPSLVLLPSIFLFATVLSLNVLAEALRKRWSQR
jgi:peptide/nickel transport system permease protein